MKIDETIKAMRYCARLIRAGEIKPESAMNVLSMLAEQIDEVSDYIDTQEGRVPNVDIQQK